jgi:hypothetical protein
MFTMLITKLGVPDGQIYPVCYEAGQTYSEETDPPLSGNLADVFVREGWAEQIQPDPDPVPEPESISESEENPPPLSWPPKKPKKEYK